MMAAFLVGQSWHVLKSWYKDAVGLEQGFRHCFADIEVCVEKWLTH